MRIPDFVLSEEFTAAVRSALGRPALQIGGVTRITLSQVEASLGGLDPGDIAELKFKAESTLGSAPQLPTSGPCSAGHHFVHGSKTCLCGKARRGTFL